MVDLSSLTKQHVAAMFASGEVGEAERLLGQECAENLPLVSNPTPLGLERLRFAAIRLSDGALPRLRDAITLAKTDWRDLLVAAAFADDVNAHRTWRPRRLERATVERWMAGDFPADVKFGLNAAVEIRFRPPHRAKGAVVSLVGLEPEPRYLVALVSGDEIEVRQFNLQDAG
jgi:hypothetical protein